MLFSNNAFSQGAPVTQGREFWVNFGNNVELTSDEVALQVRFVATKITNVTITFTHIGTTRTFTVNAGEVYTYDLTSAEKIATYSAGSTSTTSKSLHISSGEDISVYAINLFAASTDATNILPVNNYGTEYYTLSYRAIDNYSDGYTIIANESGTQVRENGTLRVTLNRGQVYSFYGDPNSDLTGRKITSNHPIAMFTTNQVARVPNDVTAGDVLFQQLAPVHSWGNTFLVPVTNPIYTSATRTRDRVRILASQDGTTITQTGGAIQTIAGSANSLSLNAGQFVELEINIVNNGCYITANKPVAVVSYLMGAANFTGISIGDPAMAWVPPIEQTVASAAIAPFFSTGESVLDDNQHYALIVTPTSTRDNTRVTIGSGTPQPLFGGTWRANTTSGYSFYSMRFPSTDRNATYYIENPAGMAIMGYGLGFYESYYYLAASAARRLDASFYVNGIHYQDADGMVFDNSSFVFDAEVQFPMSTAPGRLKWYIDNVERTAARDQLTWNTSLSPGTYHIKLVVTSYDNVEIELETTIIVFANITPGSIGSNQAICYGTAPATLTSINDGTGVDSYNWEQSTNGTTWSNATGIRNQTTYEPPALTTTTYYRRKATNGSGDDYSNVVTITVYPNLIPGAIGSNRSICYNTPPGALTSTTAASGGNGTITYQWQQYNGSTWVNVTGGTGATSASYTPPALTATTQYRRNATNACGTVSSAEVTITVAPVITPGTIGNSQSIPHNTAPAPITGLTAGAGGTGTNSYRWQSSTDGTNWTDITGPTGAGANYSPGVLTTTTLYRRGFSNNCGPVYTDPVTITVGAACTPATAVNITAGPVTVCAGDQAVLTASAGSPSVPSPTYRWYESQTSTTVLETGTTYTTPTLTTTTTYYISVEGTGYCENVAGTRREVTVTVNPRTTPGMIKITIN